MVRREPRRNESNERLEFLGDAVLGLVVTDHIYRAFPTCPKASWPRCGLGGQRRGPGRGGRGDRPGRASCCSARARRRPAGGRSRRSWPTPWRPCSAPCTSTAGGTPADKLVMAPARRADRRRRRRPGRADYKTRLQELAARRFDQLPRYEVRDEGPDHAKRFYAKVVLDGDAPGRGRGPVEEAGRAGRSPDGLGVAARRRGRRVAAAERPAARRSTRVRGAPGDAGAARGRDPSGASSRRRSSGKRDARRSRSTGIARRSAGTRSGGAGRAPPGPPRSAGSAGTGSSCSCRSTTGPTTLVVHLGMSRPALRRPRNGRRPPSTPTPSSGFRTDGSCASSTPARSASCSSRADGWRRCAALAHLGLDPLSAGWSAAVLRRALAGRHGAAQAAADGPALRRRDRQHLLRRGPLRGPAPLRPPAGSLSAGRGPPAAPGGAVDAAGGGRPPGLVAAPTPSTSTSSAPPAPTRAPPGRTAGRASPAPAAGPRSGGSRWAAVDVPVRGVPVVSRPETPGRPPAGRDLRPGPGGGVPVVVPAHGRGTGRGRLVPQPARRAGRGLLRGRSGGGGAGRGLVSGRATVGHRRPRSTSPPRHLTESADSASRIGVRASRAGPVRLARRCSSSV